MKFTKKEQSLVPTKELLNEIQKSIACKQPEQLVMLGSSDRKHIDTVFFVDKSKSTQTSCEPDIEVCNKKNSGVVRKRHCILRICTFAPRRLFSAIRR